MNIHENQVQHVLEPIKSSFSHCPRCGNPGFQPDSDKSFRCIRCEFRYYFNPGGAVAGIILNKDGSILMTRRGHDPGKGTLDLPGGFIDLMETAENALIREVYEELGVALEALEFLCTRPNRYDFGGMTYYTVDLAFVAHLPSGGILNLSDEISDVEWIDPMTIPFTEIGFSSIREILHDYQLLKVKL